jgi:LacI family transcriptional regulator
MTKIKLVLLLLETSREYGRGLLRGIAHYASLHGSWIIERQTPFYLQDSRIAESFAFKTLGHIDGIIMREQKNIRPILQRRIPVIFASFLKESIPGCSRLASDDNKIGQLAAVHLLERGFRHFAYLGYEGLFWSDNRRESFRNHLRQAGYAVNVFGSNINKASRSKTNQLKATTEWLLSLPSPVGLMACNDDCALEALEICQQAGLKVPEEIAILGADNDELVCSLSRPPLSSVSLDLENAGFQAAALLDRMMEGKSRRPQIIPVKARHVVTRHSTDVLAVDDPVIVEAIRFIRDNIRRPIQVSDILNRIAVSRRGLYDKFKKTLGCSVYRYIKRTRVEHIEQMLTVTDIPIGQIALDMGFPSSDHISAYFRSEKGCNPLEFRKRIHEHF